MHDDRCKYERARICSPNSVLDLFKIGSGQRKRTWKRADSTTCLSFYAFFFTPRIKHFPFRAPADVTAQTIRKLNPNLMLVDDLEIMGRETTRRR